MDIKIEKEELKNKEAQEKQAERLAAYADKVKKLKEEAKDK